MKKKNWVINTKLFPPKIGTGAIARPRLLRVFPENPNWRGAFITAPAGYGKTVFMIQAVKSIKQPMVWYQLDAYDNDSTAFLRYLTAGFEEHIPGLEAKMTAFINNPGADVRKKTSVFINEVTQKTGKGFILVLDDFHFITEPETQRLVMDLLLYLANVRFLISDRTLFPASFFTILAKEEYLKFTAEDLKFNSQETTLLMARNKVELSDRELAELEQKTGGWAAGLHLLTRAPNIDLGSLANIDSEEIYSYLFAEVFEKLPPETRRFLTATAVLEDFNSEFCDLFLNRNDSSDFLKYLLRHQLFLIPLNGPQKAYRYHQLFRQFLMEQLKPDEHLQLLRQAGDAAKQIGDRNRAIDYYLSAGLYEAAIRLIIEEADRIVVEDYSQRASRWLALIPKEQLANPWLALLKAVTEYNQGTMVEAEEWVNKAIEQFKLDKEKNGFAMALSYKALILLVQGRYLESLKLINSPIVKNSSDFQNIKPYAMLYTAGRLNRALSFLGKKLNEAEGQGDGYTIAQLAMDLCNLYYIKGDYDKALEMYQKLIRISDDISLVNYRIQCIPSIYRDRGELDRAFEMAKQSVAIKEECNYIAALPYAYYELASIYVDRGELKQAEKYYRRSIKTMEEGGQHLFLVLSLSYLAQCLSLQGRLVEAWSISEEALAKARGQGNYILAIGRAMAGPILIQSGREKEGLRMLEQAIKSFTKIGAKYPLCLCHGSLASILLKKNIKISTALKSARKCLQLAAGGDFIQMFLTFRLQLEPVLRVGLELDIEVSFIQEVLLRMGQPALDLLMDLAEHRDPETRRRVAPVLAEIGGAKARKVLQGLMEDKNPGVRDFARRFLLETTGEAKSKTADKVNAFRVQTLGPLIVSKVGEECDPVIWTTKKSRDLLAFLTHQEKPVSRERILAEIWPDMENQKITPLFHTTLYQLRQALSVNKDFIIYQNGEYQLAPGSFILDRLRFKETLSNINELDRETAEQLEETLLLYRGDYLEELDYPWLISEREYLKRLNLDARLKLAQYYLKISEYIKAIEHLRILAEANPLSEEFNSMLMTAYAENGDRLAVKRCFEALKKELREELGVDPSAEIRKLYYRLCDPENELK
jgi:ATP/maltotriose-dependent transcriptional regulator MalT/two-component SAPR family response regulator